jgi:hypothetical protein
MSDRFVDRLDPATYAQDEPVGAGMSTDSTHTIEMNSIMTAPPV